MKFLLRATLPCFLWMCAPSEGFAQAGGADSLYYEVQELKHQDCPKENNPDHVCSKITIRTVTIKGPSEPINNAINNAMNQEIIRSGFYENGKTLDECLHSMDQLSVEETGEVEVNVVTRYNSHGVLSVDFGFFNMYYGAAHPMYFSKTMTFNTSTGVIIRLTDMIQPTKMQEFNRIAERQFIKENGAEGWDFKPGSFKVNEQFIIQDNGILFTFDPYELGTYVMGSPQMTIPWSAVKTCINPATPIAGLLPK
ncbi:MAG: RsiV family protein [Flavobacteriales bacterium]